eukprot:CAMPEP_0168246966 /NCGR_PEP_ID=MMETSP0141_2-20121125/634_1 /TAXON_ID=44445 /ORGANISM="Pseudo-nitzschia australis, Strain 10249 10 AB" /LENGTH=723 /DNA_ID=CAMNT_0008182697 /DNA_START=550 /DNA_END=2721 /DNA_ORIENTATION=-
MKFYSLVIAALSFDRAFWLVNGIKQSIDVYEIYSAGDGSSKSPSGEVFTLEPVLEGSAYFETDSRWILPGGVVNVELYAGVALGELCDTGTLLVSSESNSIQTKYGELGTRERNNSYETVTSNGVVGAANFFIQKYDSSLTSPIFVQGKGDTRGEITLCVRASLMAGTEVVSFSDTRMVVTIDLQGNFETSITLAAPSDQPSSSPSFAPSESPSQNPSESPSFAPSASPSQDPSESPSFAPSANPTSAPSLSSKPTFKGETFAPSAGPSESPTAAPSAQPSGSPSAAPSANPTSSPSAQPSGSPSAQPSGSPSAAPSADPSGSPSAAPSANPTGAPSLSWRPTFKGETYEPSAPPISLPSSAPSESQEPSEAPSLSSVPTETPSSTTVVYAGVPPSYSAEQVIEAFRKVAQETISDRGRRLAIDWESLRGVDLVITANLIECALLTEGFGLTNEICYEVTVTITAEAISVVVPVVETQKIEQLVIRDDFEDQLEEVGLVGVVTQLPPSQEPSSVPSSKPSASAEPSPSPSAQPTSSPSAQPTLIEKINCENDPLFRLNGSKRKDCNWVFRRIKKRCNRVQKATKKSVRFYCPLSCKKKCEEYKTAAPSSAPTINICGLDDLDYRFDNKPSKDCRWASKRPEFRCRKKDKRFKKKRVFKFCKSACNLRCACKDSNKKFKIDSVPTKCKNQEKTDCNKRATKGKSLKLRSVADFCPKKCGKCLAY